MSTTTPEAIAEGWVWDINEGQYHHPLTGQRLNPYELPPDLQQFFPPQPTSGLSGREYGDFGSQHQRYSFPPQPYHAGRAWAYTPPSHKPTTTATTVQDTDGNTWSEQWSGARPPESYYHTSNTGFNNNDQNNPNITKYSNSSANNQYYAEYFAALANLPPFQSPQSYPLSPGAPGSIDPEAMGNHQSSTRHRSQQNTTKGKERASNFTPTTGYPPTPSFLSPTLPTYPPNRTPSTTSPQFAIPPQSSFILDRNSVDPYPTSKPSAPSYPTTLEDEATEIALAIALSLSETQHHHPSLPSTSFTSPRFFPTSSRPQKPINKDLESDLLLALNLHLKLETEQNESASLALAHQLQEQFVAEERVRVESQEEYARRLQEEEDERVLRERERQEREDRDFAERLAVELEREQGEEVVRRREEEEEQERKVEVVEKKLEECSVCLEDKRREEMLLLPCKHYLCITDECLMTPINLALQASKPYRCCLLPIPPALLRPHLPAPLFTAYNRLHIASITTNPLYCANPACSTFIEPSSILAGIGTCPECNTQTCRHCKMAAHKGVCKDDQAGNGVKTLGKQRGWRECPGCGEMVEKTQGCNHVRCRCGQEFCYKCGKMYSVCLGRC